MALYSNSLVMKYELENPDDLENCAEGLTRTEIEPVMQEFVSTNVVETSSGYLKSMEFAKIITKTEEEIKMK